MIECKENGKWSVLEAPIMFRFSKIRSKSVIAGWGPKKLVRQKQFLKSRIPEQGIPRQDQGEGAFQSRHAYNGKLPGYQLQDGFHGRGYGKTEDEPSFFYRPGPTKDLGMTSCQRATSKVWHWGKGKGGLFTFSRPRNRISTRSRYRHGE